MPRIHRRINAAQRKRVAARVAEAGLKSRCVTAAEAEGEKDACTGSVLPSNGRLMSMNWRSSIT